jgi:uncharacterized protein YkwD
VAVTVPTAAGTAGAATPKELRRKLFSLTNSARRNNGMRPFTINWRLSRRATEHSRRMANRSTVFHSANLYRMVRPWHPSIWGENVGMAGTVRRVHKLFMRSAVHRGNILRGSFSHVGIGVVQGAAGRVWVTAVFYGR